MKYPLLKSPCKECELKCFRVENPNFTGDKNCKYAEKENWKQEEIKQCMEYGIHIKKSFNLE